MLGIFHLDTTHQHPVVKKLTAMMMALQTRHFKELLRLKCNHKLELRYRLEKTYIRFPWNRQSNFRQPNFHS